MRADNAGPPEGSGEPESLRCWGERPTGADKTREGGMRGAEPEGRAAPEAMRTEGGMTEDERPK